MFSLLNRSFDKPYLNFYLLLNNSSQILLFLFLSLTYRMFHGSLQEVSTFFISFFISQSHFLKENSSFSGIMESHDSNLIGYLAKHMNDFLISFFCYFKYAFFPSIWLLHLKSFLSYTLIIYFQGFLL